MIYWKVVLLTAYSIVLNPQDIHSFSTPQQIQSHKNNVATIRSDYFSYIISLPSALYCTSGTNNGDGGQRQTSYRSIGEVVGGLHGGKYNFGSGSSNIPSSNFAGTGGARSPSGNDIEEEEEEDMPNWAQRMCPPPLSVAISTCNAVEVIEVPSNSNRSDGMVRKAMVSIQNDERTWERYYAKIMPRVIDGGDGSSIVSASMEGEDAPFRVFPRLGHLAPRGGASNACDLSKPYSDSITLSIIHREGVKIVDDTAVEWWLVAGTEEEKWYYKLKYCS